MITFSQVKKNPQILQFIKQTEAVLAALSFTDHGLRHSTLVSDRARSVAKELGLINREQELAAIASFCHDMANFVSRTYHNYFGAILFHQVFQNDLKPKEMTAIMQAIANHDKKIEDISLISPIAAILVLADKSDVCRSRVTTKDMNKIKSDIHDRVNYATEKSHLKIDKRNKRITLTLKIDTKFVPLMEYFEIFTKRMVYCREAAKHLGYDFGLVINNFKLL